MSMGKGNPGRHSYAKTLPGRADSHSSSRLEHRPMAQKRAAWVPAPPPPPTFRESTAYEPSTGHLEYHDTSTSRSGGGTRKLFDRLTSLRMPSHKHGTYNRLHDEDVAVTARRLEDIHDQGEVPDSPLRGAVTIQMNQIKSSSKASGTVRIIQEGQNLSEAGYAAEYERLESELGAGMNSITERPFTYTAMPVAPGTYARRPNSEPLQAHNAQEVAEKTGDIVAVSDIPVDISDSFGGGHFETQNMVAGSIPAATNESQKSYYFPEDPDMPSWRPLTMGSPWLAMLSIIAIGLAGLQEFLCQLSLQRAREGRGLAQFDKADNLSLTEFFTWKYAPIIVFVFYGILWQMSDFEVKRLEPYYQLSRKTGATAGESLNMDYLTFMSWLVPLRALRHRHLVPVLQSASVSVYPEKKDRKSDELKFIRIEPPWSRAVSACLVLVAICGMALMYAMRRKSGLLSNPQGIAGIAAMATRSHILTDFHGLDEASLNKIHKQLRNRRYILHKSSLWQGEYIRNSKEKLHEHSTDPRPLMLRPASGVAFVTYITMFIAAIPIFTFVEPAIVVTDKLRFLLTGIATTIRILWNTMNCDVRMLQPFYILSKRNAPAKTLTLDYTGTNPLFLPIIALLNRHWLVAAVAFGSILGEVLTVCVSAINVDGTRFVPGNGHDNDNVQDERDRHNQEQTFRSFWISLLLSFIILFYLLCIACLTYKRRHHKFMPRQIGSMASVLAMIYQSKMLLGFVDTEKLTSGQMTKHLERQGKTYAFGWFSGRDGDDHLGIDEEPILKEYVYGQKWKETRIIPHQVGTWEHY
ncbi:hypothetical protein E8E13_008412 [Curvularia kusanoi]|uniref:Uncharacterized protein n=1 Tax=Curvularia kusanoi TaxID=90978 RepID=A0A9P4WB08_CURKU|nr:hypothetical protein E8E13_008412 [Curvularia kusanoi]